jgi:hypothetical protein
MRITISTALANAPHEAIAGGVGWGGQGPIVRGWVSGFGTHNCRDKVVITREHLHVEISILSMDRIELVNHRPEFWVFLREFSAGGAPGVTRTHVKDDLPNEVLVGQPFVLEIHMA